MLYLFSGEAAISESPFLGYPKKPARISIKDIYWYPHIDIYGGNFDDNKCQ